jgi:Lipid A 3-O-deacylase (PagL)
MRAALWIFTITALPAVAGAQTRTTDALERGDRSFGVWAGASLSPAALFGTITDRRLFLTGLRLEYVLGSANAVTTAYTVDVHPVAVMTNTPRYGVQQVRARNGSLVTRTVETGRAADAGAGVSPLGLQFYSAPIGAARLFAGASAGGIWFNRDMPVAGARRFNFALQLGAGAELLSRGSGVLLVGYKFHHLSNAGTAPLNPGVDGHVFYVGLMRRRAARQGERVAAR